MRRPGRKVIAALSTLAVAGAAIVGSIYIPGGAKELAPCVAPAVLCVAPSGNDSTCARTMLSKPCATFNKAFQLAQIGDVVQVECASYPEQDLADNASLDSAGQNTYVTFEPVPGQAPPGFGSGATGAGCVQVAALGGCAVFAKGASHVEIDSMYINSMCLGKNISNHSWDGTVTDWRFDNDVNHTLAWDSVARFQWYGGSLGDNTGVGSSCVSNCTGYTSLTDGTLTYAASSGESWIQAGSGSTVSSSDVLIQGASFHDFYRKNGAHSDCLGVNATTRITIRDSKFWNCDTQSVFFTYSTVASTTPLTASDILFENNWVAPPTDNGGQIQSGVGFEFKGSDAQTTSNAVVRNNVILGGINWSNDSGHPVPASNIVFVGNLTDSAVCSGLPVPTAGVTWEYTIAAAYVGSCPGTGNTTAPLPLVAKPAPPNQASLNYDLTTPSTPENYVPASAYATPTTFTTAFSLYDPTQPPAADIHGNPRPCGTNYTAGAEETCA